jgi:LAGLIDADG DNA endonuclease family
MDDGSKAKGSGILLHTNSYTYEEVLLLISILKQKFNIDSNPRKKYDRFLIYIEVESVPIVVKLVKVYMHPFFYYKIGEKESV